MDNIRQRKMDSLLMRNIGALAQIKRLMDMRQIADCQSLTTPLMVHIMCPADNIEEEHRSMQWIQRQLLQARYPSPVGMSKGKNGVPLPQPVVLPKHIRIKNASSAANVAPSVLIGGSMDLIHKLRGGCTLKSKPYVAKGSGRRQFWSQCILD